MRGPNAIPPASMKEECGNRLVGAMQLRPSRIDATMHAMSQYHFDGRGSL
jgi:hypothetical protein